MIVSPRACACRTRRACRQRMRARPHVACCLLACLLLAGDQDAARASCSSLASASASLPTRGPFVCGYRVCPSHDASQHFSIQFVYSAGGVGISTRHHTPRNGAEPGLQTYGSLFAQPHRTGTLSLAPRWKEAGHAGHPRVSLLSNLLVT